MGGGLGFSVFGVGSRPGLASKNQGIKLQPRVGGRCRRVESGRSSGRKEALTVAVAFNLATLLCLRRETAAAGRRTPRRGALTGTPEPREASGRCRSSLLILSGDEPRAEPQG